MLLLPPQDIIHPQALNGTWTDPCCSYTVEFYKGRHFHFPRLHTSAVFLGNCLSCNSGRGLRRRSLLGAVPVSSTLPALGEEPHFTRLQLTRSIKVMADLNLFSSDFSELWDQKSENRKDDPGVEGTLCDF